MFDSFFNPPVPFTAIDLADRSVKLARVNQRRRGKPRLVGTLNGEIPEGLVVQGRVQDVPALAKVLRGILRSSEARRLTTPAAAMALPEEHCFIRTVRVPKLAPQELSQAIRWEAEAAIPLPPQDAVVSWQIAPDIPEADHRDVLVAAIPKEIAESYVDLLRAVPIDPLAFEPESFAIARALLRPDDRETTLVIDLGREHTGVIIIQDHSVRVTANIPIAARVFTERIAATRAIPLERAEEMKRKVGITLEGDGPAIREALTPVLDDLVKQTKQFFEFFETHAHIDLPTPSADTPSSLTIRRVLLTGGDALMPGLKDYLAEALGVPVSIGDPFVNLAAVPRRIAHHPLFTTAIGLALYRVDTSSL
jgi:type IV pilus assembly protein PilM